MFLTFNSPLRSSSHHAKLGVLPTLACGLQFSFEIFIIDEVHNLDGLTDLVLQFSFEIFLGRGISRFRGGRAAWSFNSPLRSSGAQNRNKICLRNTRPSILLWDLRVENSHGVSVGLYVPSILLWDLRAMMDAVMEALGIMDAFNSPLRSSRTSRRWIAPGRLALQFSFEIFI